MNLIPENTMERILNGEDVTPSCRAEYFVKQAIANAGSGGGDGDEYETVAEIAVGTMTEQGGLYMYQPENVTFPTDLTENDELYWGEYPLTRESGNVYTYNFSSEMEPTGNPAYILQVDEETGVVDAIVANSDAIENTTVTILKKVSGGGEGAAPLVVTLTRIDETHASTDIPIADIYAAFNSGRDIRMVYPYVFPGARFFVTRVEYDAQTETYAINAIGMTNDKYAAQSAHAVSTGINTLNIEMVHTMPIPPYDNTVDSGKVLTVTENGLEWVLPT